MKDTIVLYPTATMGHLVFMVELGKFIKTHNPSLSIHILITVAPYDSGSTSRYIATISATAPWINFHNLPAITLPPNLLSSTSNHENLTFEVLCLNNPNVLQNLLSISKNFNIKAIADFFCFHTLSVASQLSIPTYVFFSSSSCCLACLLYFPFLHCTTHKSFKELDTHLNIPGLPQH